MYVAEQQNTCGERRERERSLHSFPSLPPLHLIAISPHLCRLAPTCPHPTLRAPVHESRLQRTAARCGDGVRMAHARRPPSRHFAAARAKCQAKAALKASASAKCEFDLRNCDAKSEVRKRGVVVCCAFLTGLVCSLLLGARGSRRPVGCGPVARRAVHG